MLLKKYIHIFSLGLIIPGVSIANEQNCNDSKNEYKNYILEHKSELEIYYGKISNLKWIGSNEKRQILDLINNDSKIIYAIEKVVDAELPINVNGLICQKKYHELSQITIGETELFKRKNNSIDKIILEYGASGLNSGCYRNNNCVNEAILYRKTIENNYGNFNKLNTPMIEINNLFVSSLTSKDLTKKVQLECKSSIVNNYKNLIALNKEITKFEDNINNLPWLNIDEKNTLNKVIVDNKILLASYANTIKKSYTYWMKDDVSDLCNEYYNSSYEILKDKAEKISKINNLIEKILELNYKDSVCLDKYGCQKMVHNEFEQKLFQILSEQNEQKNEADANIIRLRNRLFNLRK